MAASGENIRATTQALQRLTVTAEDAARAFAKKRGEIRVDPGAAAAIHDLASAIRQMDANLGKLANEVRVGMQRPMLAMLAGSMNGPMKELGDGIDRARLAAQHLLEVVGLGK